MLHADRTSLRMQGANPRPTQGELNAARHGRNRKAPDAAQGEMNVLMRSLVKLGYQQNELKPVLERLLGDQSQSRARPKRDAATMGADDAPPVAVGAAGAGVAAPGERKQADSVAGAGQTQQERPRRGTAAGEQKRLRRSKKRKQNSGEAVVVAGNGDEPSVAVTAAADGAVAASAAASPAHNKAAKPDGAVKPPADKHVSESPAAATLPAADSMDVDAGATTKEVHEQAQAQAELVLLAAEAAAASNATAVKQEAADLPADATPESAAAALVAAAFRNVLAASTGVTTGGQEGVHAGDEQGVQEDAEGVAAADDHDIISISSDASAAAAAVADNLAAAAEVDAAPLADDAPEAEDGALLNLGWCCDLQLDWAFCCITQS
jgi:hypothetical protein